MARRKITAGIAGVTVPIFVGDTSATDGSGLAVAYNAVGLAAEYRRQGQASWTTFALSAGTLGTWSSGGWVADGSLTGAYEVGIPDAALATGARWAEVRYRGAANMPAVLLEFELDAVNYQSTTSFVLGVNGMAPPANWNLTAVDSGGRSAANVTYVGGSPIPAPSSPAVVPGVLIVDLRYANGSTATFPSVVPANVTQINTSTAAAAGLYALSLDPSVAITGTVAASPAPTQTSFALTNLSITPTANDQFKGQALAFTSGNNTGEPEAIASFTLSTGVVTFASPGFVHVPAANDTVKIIGRLAPR